MLPWVKEWIQDRLGFTPYLGTLNLSVPSGTQINRLLKEHKVLTMPPKRGLLPGRFHRALIMGTVEGAVVRPEVHGYPEDIIELIAPVSLREKFDLEDGDQIEVKIWLE